MNKILLLISLMLINGLCFSNEGGSKHIELVANSSVFLLKADETYNGMSVMPELRFRQETGDHGSAFISVGFASFTQFTDENDDSEVINKKDDSEYTVTLGYSYDMDPGDSGLSVGLDHFVVGIGRGNFNTNKELNVFDEGNFIFVGFTVNALGFEIK
mgnify:CR=1 FL=1